MRQFFYGSFSLQNKSPKLLTVEHWAQSSHVMAERPDQQSAVQCIYNGMRCNARN